MWYLSHHYRLYYYGEIKPQMFTDGDLGHVTIQFAIYYVLQVLHLTL